MTSMNYQKQSSIEKDRGGEVFDHKAEFEKYQSLGRAGGAKTYLCVPFNEKETAKGLGARWDAERKQWYCEGKTKRFKRWMPKKGNIDNRIGKLKN